jgi:uncharacterized damage-inducible protein DinB
MNRTGLLALCNYNVYANQLVMDTVSQLSEAELIRQSSPSHSSIRELLLHMLAVEAGYLARCQEQSLERPELSTLDDIRRYWRNVGQITQQFVESQTEAGLARELTIHLDGHAFRFPVWQMLVQTVLHSTHHRGELSILLTELGHPLPTLDAVIQFAEQSGQPWPWK